MSCQTSYPKHTKKLNDSIPIMVKNEINTIVNKPLTQQELKSKEEAIKALLKNNKRRK